MFKEGKELIWLLLALFLATILYGVLVENKIIDPDNAYEEAIEEIFEERSGLKLDLSPGDGDDRDFEDVDIRKH